MSLTIVVQRIKYRGLQKVATKHTVLIAVKNDNFQDTTKSHTSSIATSDTK
jgi:hypothetical protein